MVRAGNRALEVAEGIVYAGIAIFLLILALGAFVIAARYVPSLFGEDSAAKSALEILDTLLLVFIVVELLFAVRITIARRELIAEPFLLVGIIASIKEIVVLSVKAADEIGTGTSFSDAMWEVAVLGVLVILLGATALLLRRKEREPGEGDDSGPFRPDEAGDPAPE
ncbi:MAG TPA: phosphate-starvation-inducible PsiE family protein [Nakamurella multipartita]|nr:phosphate-starvation-inducible PsiE family protein [Nakamurella multipartita]